jgi:(2Fe-2S) ferredoxin
LPALRGQSNPDAGFIRSAGVIDDENISPLRVLHCFEKHIDAAEMPGWKGAARQAEAEKQRGNPGRRDPKWNLQPQGRVGDERRGKAGKAFVQQLVIRTGTSVDRRSSGCQPARMPQRERYLFVCTNRRSPDNKKGSCAEKGSEEIRLALKEQLAARGLAQLRARACGSSCLDQCSSGVSILVEPDHFFYGHVTMADLPEIVEGIASAQRVERLVLTPEDLAKG